MQSINSIPAEDGFRMPGEFEKHRGCILIWPVRPGSWTNKGLEAKTTFTEIARAIAVSEKVFMLCNKNDYDEVLDVFKADENISVHVVETDDAWARDTGPTCVVNSEGEVRGIDWKFNAWGGDYDGLYPDYDNDDKVAFKVCELLDFDCYEARPFVLEGGSIHSDGEGTVLVTSSCLLSKGRNPELSKTEIENKLKQYLGAEKIIWLPRGIEGDETNEHVDNVCAFVKPGHVILAWTDNENDQQWEPSNASLKVLENETDARGRRFVIHKMPIPEKPVCITKEELDALEFEEGEDVRNEGERLAASYVNFYIANKGIIVPQFGDKNDELAVNILRELFPEREIYPIYARSIIVGGGNIHCITQQIPMDSRIKSDC